VKVLTDRQQRFVDEYVYDTNATQAAIRAGYSAKSAPQQAVALMKHPEVLSAIDAKRQRLAIKTEVTAARVLEKWAAVAFHGCDDPDPVKRAAALADPDPVRLRASELCAKHLGMLIERHEHKDTTSPLASVTGAELLAMLEAVRQARLEAPVDVTPRLTAPQTRAAVAGDPEAGPNAENPTAGAAGAEAGEG
jgi:hypothetical protein